MLWSKQSVASLHYMLMVCVAGLACSASVEALSFELLQAAELVSERHLSAPDPAAVPTSNIDDFKAYLASLDAYSQLLTPAEYGAYQNSRDGRRRSGIGAAVFPVDDALLLVPLQTGALYASGVHDVVELLSIDDQPLSIKSINALQARLSAAKPPVQLTLREVSSGEIRPLQLNKSHIKLGIAELHTQAAVPFIRLHDIVPHITAYSLQQVYKELLSVAAAAPAIILDLRYSPGGDLTEAAKIMDLFMPAGQLLFTTYDKQGERVVLHSTGDGIVGVLPQNLYLLVGPLTASSAEVMAKTLSHYGAKTLGRKTFGKCLVQEIFELSHGYALSLTTQQVMAAGEDACTGNGFIPDVLLPDEYLINSTKAVIDYADTEVFKSDKTGGIDEQPIQPGKKTATVVITEPHQRLTRFEKYAADVTAEHGQVADIEKPESVDAHNVICAEVTLTKHQNLSEYKQHLDELYDSFDKEIKWLNNPEWICLGPFSSKNKAQKLAELINEIWHDQFRFYPNVPNHIDDLPLNID